MAARHWFINKSAKKLIIVNTVRKSGYFRSFHHLYETGAERQRRLERRISAIKVLEVLISGMDLETFAFGCHLTRYDGTEDFYTYGVKYLVERTGLTEHTVCRVLADLEACGYMKSVRNGAIGKDGKLVRFYSLRILTHRLFIDLGFKKDTIIKVQNWKRKDNAEKRRKTTKFTQGLNKLYKIVSGKYTTKKRRNEYNSDNINNTNSATNKEKTISPGKMKQLLAQAKYAAEKFSFDPIKTFSALKEKYLASIP